MKGTEKIIAHILSDAQARADEIIAAAEQQCAGIRDDYDRQAKAAYAEKIRAGVRECEDRSESMKKIAGMEARKSLLALKQEMVSASFDRARLTLESLPEEKYSAFLAKLAAESAVSDDEELVLNEKDRATVGERVLAEANAILAAQGRTGALTLADGAGDFSGGVILRRGNIETNCTTELLVDMCRGDMAATLAGVLFE